MVEEADILNARILIVDDQEEHGNALKELLERTGYLNVDATTDPTRVRQLHVENEYKLILLDLQMPGMSGFDVMRDLRALGSDEYLCVFVITGAPSFKLSALKAGAKDFISKPFDPEEVLTRIHNMLEVRLLHAAVREDADRLMVLALHDPLTGLANRRLLTDRVASAISNARRNKSDTAVVYLDLDGFKQINDTLGHGVGDALLRKVGERLVAMVRKEDTVARLGGDEFMIALWHVSGESDAAAVAAKLIKTVSEPYAIDEHRVTVTMSAGVGIFPAHGGDAGTLMQSADAALYAAKRAGRNAFRISNFSAASVQYSPTSPI